jgi:hypothetical protein
MLLRGDNIGSDSRGYVVRRGGDVVRRHTDQANDGSKVYSYVYARIDCLRRLSKHLHYHVATCSTLVLIVLFRLLG